MILNPFIYQSGGGSGPILIVTVTGATATSVVATKSGVSKALAYDSTLSKWWAELPSTGAWTVTAENGAISTSSTIVNAGNVTVYEVSMQLTKLPAGFKELEYISSTGLEYIDTGLPGVNGFKFQGNIGPTESASEEWTAYLGVADNYNGYANASIYTSLSRNLTYFNGGGRTATTSNFQVGSKNTIITDLRINKTYASVNGVELTFSGTDSGERRNGSIGIFAGHMITNQGTWLWGMFSKLTFWESAFNVDSIDYDFVPAKATQNTTAYNGNTQVSAQSGEVGLFDLTRNRFIVNGSGSGAFIAGPEV